MQFLCANKHTGIKWEKLHTSYLGILTAESGLKQSLITQRGFQQRGERFSLHRQKSIKAELSADREACWVIPERLLLSSGQMRSITGSQERDTEESVAHRGCGDAEKFGKSLLQMRWEKNQHLFIHLDSSSTRAQTPTCLTQLQQVKERISLLFLTLHPSSLALSSAEAINQACALSFSLSLSLSL